ncbi:MAG: nucleoside recognition protein [Ruminococcus sp.]|nr:nucleoside recognition protein [Ruminococcus sp.]
MGIAVAALAVISVIFSLCTGDISRLSEGFSKSVTDSAELALTLACSMTFWSGIMRVAEKAGIVRAVCRAVRPVLRLLMPDVFKNDKAAGAVSMNVAANLLGMGNAATPLGLAAMRELEAARCSRRSIALFILLNTSSIQLLPATVIALRTQAGSASPADCVAPILFNSAAALAAGLIMLFILYAGKGRASCSFSH